MISQYISTDSRGFQRTWSCLGIFSGLNFRGARSMGRYRLFFSRGAPTPSSRRTSATVRMGTQPLMSGTAAVESSAQATPFTFLLT